LSGSKVSKSNADNAIVGSPQPEVLLP